MTYPITSEGNNIDSEHDLESPHDHPDESHGISTEIDSSSSLQREEFDDYQIVRQDAPLDERPAFYASSDLYTLLSTTRETDFDFNSFDFFVPVGGGPETHYHTLEQETWHVTDGEVQFNLGNQGERGIVVPEGTTVFVPRGRTHGFENVDSTASISGTTPGARTLTMTTPGALDLFFDSAAERVTDRDSPIPASKDPTPEDILNLTEFSARTGAGINLTASDPNYQPPEGVQDYTLILPEDAEGKVVEQAKELDKIDGYSVWTTGDQEGLEKRPTFIGDFGIEYTSLASYEESGNEFDYNQFSLEPETTAPANEKFPDPVISKEHQLFYVNEGELTVKINGKTEIAQPDTYVHINPGNEYTIANFSKETVESLAITIPEQSEPDASQSFPSPLTSQDGHRVDGGNGNDELFGNQDDRLFGLDGDDTLDASNGKSNNRLDGGNGNDELLGAKNGELVGGNGDDILRIVSGDNNLLYGNGGADQFWLANGTLPNTVTETRQPTDAGLPTLEDTRNTIFDFESGVDKIGISGIAGVSSFDDLKLLPSFDNLGSTSIVAVVDGTESEISLGNVADVIFNELTADDFVFA
jgi:mannose-6-phosphate isomerase-like protein (cupin superfamily)